LIPNPPFSKKEFDYRTENVRKEMKGKGLDAILLYAPENIFYLTGFQTTGYFTYQTLVVPVDSPPFLVVRRIEEMNVKTTSIVNDYTLYVDAQDPIEMTVKALEERGLANGSLGVEMDSWFLTVAQFQRLQTLLGGRTFVDCTGMVEKFRIIKSPAELQYMKKAAEIAEKSMAAAIEAAELGKTEDDVAAAAHFAAITNGSTYLASPPQLTTGTKTGDSHQWWEGGRIECGNPVFLELGACVKRYHAAMMRAGFVGPPTNEFRRMGEACKQGFEAGLSAMKPGAKAGDVYRAVAKELGNAGFGEHVRGRAARTGYSIGIAFPPGWDEGDIISLRDGDPTTLQPGMTFHLISSIRIPGRISAGCSETVVVREDGAESLMKFDRGIFIN